MSVYDNFKKGASKVGSKSKEMMGSAKIKLELDNLKKQKNKEIENMGASVYEMYLNNSIKQKNIKEMCQIISALDKKIKQKEEDLEQVGQSENQEAE